MERNEYIDKINELRLKAYCINLFINKPMYILALMPYLIVSKASIF